MVTDKKPPTPNPGSWPKRPTTIPTEKKGGLPPGRIETRTPKAPKQG